MRRPGRFRIGLLALLVATLLSGPYVNAGLAYAHDELVSSSPASSQTVPHVPAAIALTFEEAPVAMGIRVVVTGPAGPVQQGAPKLTGDTVTQDLQGGAPAGAYQVEWRVTSDDGHPVSGSFTFTAQAAGAATSSAPADLPVAPPGSHGGIWLLAGLLAAVTVGLLMWHRSRLRQSSSPTRNPS